MKNKLFYLYGLIFFSILILCGIIFYKKNNLLKNAPPVNLKLKNFITQPYNFKKDQILFALSLECDYCLDLIMYIGKQKDGSLKKYQIILAISDTEERVSQFYKKYKVELGNEIKIYNDRDKELFVFLKPKSFPSFYILQNNTVINHGFGLDEIKSAVESIN